MESLRHNNQFFLSVVALLTIWVSASCTRTLDLPDVGDKRKIVLLGELTAMDSIYLRAGQSVPLTASSSLKFELLQNLSLTIEESGSAIPLQGMEDYSTLTLYTMPFSSPDKVKPATTYKLTASHPELGSATASVEVPAPFAAEFISMKDAMFNGDSVIEVTLRIDDPSDVQNYYSIEALKQSMSVEGYFFYQGSWVRIWDARNIYLEQKSQGIVQEKFDTTYYRSYTRQLLFTQDVNSEWSADKSSAEPSRRLFFRDRTFNGQSYITTVYVVKDLFGTSGKGRVMLDIKSISPAYFSYLVRYDEQTDLGGFNTIAQPVKAEGNIRNGVGIVGGVYKNVFILSHDTWEF